MVGLVQMKVLVLTSENREPDFSTVYRHLQAKFDVEILTLAKHAQRNLRKHLSRIDFDVYDRIVLDLHFKHVSNQTRFLKTLEGLLIYEEDACQNYLAGSRWRGKFSQYYRRLPNARVVVTGASVAERLRQEGVDVRFIPKGYDSDLLCSLDVPRDIELGFIGRTGSGVYADRKQYLDALVSEEGLKVLRTEPGLAYRDMLNRIRFFVSADIGFGEYMAKNFEAMACGCVLLAWRQESEEHAIGLVDGVHLKLYSSLEELRSILHDLRCNPEMARMIAESGREFVNTFLSHDRLAAQLANALTEAFPSPPEPSVWEKIRSLSWLRN